MTEKAWKIVGCSLAGVVMAGALVYYNFIDKAPESGVAVGNHCIDFTAKTVELTDDGTFAMSENEFTLSEQIGTVCVINFWETWCQGCIEELPEFDHIQKDYGEAVKVIAIAGVTSTEEELVDYMNEKGWKNWSPESEWTEFSVTFAHLSFQTCIDLGYIGQLPRTVVVDKSGMVAHEQDASMTYNALKNILDGIL